MRKRRKKGRECTGSIRVGIGYRPPYRWEELLGFFRLRAVAGVEYVDDCSYSRVICKEDREGITLAGWIRVTNDEKRWRLNVEVSDSLVPVVSGVIADVKRMFDTGCDPAEISGKLTGLQNYCEGGFRDGTRLPGAAGSFEICVRAVLGQQITVKAARTLAERLVKNFGRPVDTGKEGLSHAFASAQDICGLEGRIEDHLGPLGITSSRAAAIRSIAELFTEGRINWEKDRPEKIMETLMEIRGIGSWTAKYIVMRAISVPDVFLETDAGVKEGMPDLTPAEMKKISEKWRPWRSYAVIGIWNSLS